MADLDRLQPEESLAPADAADEDRHHGVLYGLSKVGLRLRGRGLTGRSVNPFGFEFKKAEMGNTVRFEIKTPREVATRHENSYAQLNAFDWSK